MSDGDQMKEKVVEAVDLLKPKKINKSPKTSQKDILACRLEYETGDWKSLTELGARFGIHHKTLQARITREGWKEKRLVMIGKVESIVCEKALSLVERQGLYLKRLAKRAEKYEQLIDNSIAQTGELIEPSDLDALTRSESRISELSRVAYRIPTLSNTDITSQGKDLGTSFVQAIAALRDSQSTPKLSSQDLKAALEAEIIE